MTTVQTAPTVRHPAARQIEVLLCYGDADVERAADLAGMELSPAECDAILQMLDDDVGRLIRTGFDAALARFVEHELRMVDAGHRVSEDD
jgi:hypothetical protein